MEERGSLWYNVLCAKYSEERGSYVFVGEGVMCGGKTLILLGWGVVF